MTKSNFSLKWQHIIYPFVIVLSIIYIAKRGFHFGQWLFDVLH